MKITKESETDQLLLMPLDMPFKHRIKDIVGSKTWISRESVQSTIRKMSADSGTKNAFFVGDMGEVQRQFVQWTQLLPRVQPFFAVKCNPDPIVVKCLARLGAGFDCSSIAELQLVLDEGIGAHNIIYAHPCKPASHVRFAKANGVEMMTFDNADEL
ncbi:Ornithine decarboxylase, partial [Kickxella alabastrina]